MLVFYLNAVGSLLAVAANLYGVRYGDTFMRPVRAAVGALAGLYFGGYVWVLETGDDIAWSRFYRWVALVTWIVVWILPPVLGARTHQRVKRAIRRIGDA